MKKKELTAAVIIALMCAGGGHGVAHAAQDEGIDEYTLDPIEVRAARTKNAFGDIITEQSYYRTGGDVDVITSDDIEERHYPDVTSAIKTLPGVQVNSIGYHGGEYGAGTQYNTTVTINGDDRVVVCLDGRRVDNAVSGLMGSKSANWSKALANLDQITSIDNIEKIEIIKGPGASKYGADATGGVINIITKKGTLTPQGKIDLATGSYGHHVYRFNYSGSTKDGSLRYFISGMRDRGAAGRYYDRMTGKNYRSNGTQFNDAGYNIRIDKYFDDTHSLTFSMNHTDAYDGYPITVPDYRYMTKAEYEAMMHRYKVEKKYGAIPNQGYRNNWYLRGFNGTATGHNNFDYDLTYSFGKDHGMESYIRAYYQQHKYWLVWGPSDDAAWPSRPIPTPWDPEWDEYVRARTVTDKDKRNRDNDYNHGLEGQFGKSFGKHDVLFGWAIDWSRHESFSTSNITHRETATNVKQTTLLGFVQDKIHVNDRLEIAPALRWQHSNAASTTAEAGSTTAADSKYSKVTAAINAEYLFQPGFSIFAGWTQVNRPLKPNDYKPDATLYKDQKLENERGNAYTIGLKKEFSPATSIFMNYDYTDMANAISRQSVWDDTAGDFKTKSVNAKQRRRAFNVGVNHRFNNHWKMRFAYSTVDEHWTAKRGMVFQPGLGIDSILINAYINSTRPKHKTVLDVSYENGKWSSALTSVLYSGMDTRYFTAKRFLVLDWVLNYKINKDATVYLTVDNLTNEGYEVKFHPYIGKGAYAMPGRSFMLGVDYRF
ncbi:TonB-dependent siderophore receptor [Selenomonas sp. F0473]|uniref:TonB-dependent receptor plug domain-containing protein n=1 Tax=Selenomonas sp. F0473 TaxID=999423 RepID=UPI00029E2920|nr:TonB-dependent receptor [Selenomonas sp. F0473]EKU71017.1 hypothetical protein HMPREF9161_01111 [Selenomonas sp. F0473]